MNLPRFAVKNPVATIMVMMLIIILGVVSWTNLPLDLMPDMNPPIVAVMTSYPGAGPEEVKEMVTKPIEQVVGASQGLKTMTSQSSTGVSLIIAQFDWGVDTSEIREDLASRLGRIQLAEGVDEPTLLKFDPSMMPIMQFTVADGEDIAGLQNKVENNILPQLQNIEGVASVSVSGGYNEEVLVQLDQKKMEQFHLSQEQITQLIQGNNLTYPGGMVSGEDEKLNLRIMGKVDSIESLRQLPVSLTPADGTVKVVKLVDIAQVDLAQKDMTTLARSNGQESLMVSIQKEGTANTAQVSKEVQTKMNELSSDNPDLKFSVASDQGEIIEKSVSNVGSSLLYGALFAVLVISIFLRSAGSTLIIALSIPFSVIATFVMMFFSGLSLNIMSLGGLALGVGMLVDNAIVVLENIYRHMALSKSRAEAAIKGTYEVAGAITSSTLTTIAVFLPVVFIGGMVGELFKELAMTVSFSLAASLLVALTVIPCLAVLLINPGKLKSRRESTIYKNIITWALNNRLVTLGLVVLLFLGSLVMVPRIGTEFLPAQDEGMFNIDIKLSEGSTLNQTLKVVEEVEQAAKNIPEIDILTATIGGGSGFSGYSTEENTAAINVKLTGSKERSKSTAKIMTELKQNLASLGKDVSLNFQETNSLAAMSGEPSAVEVRIAGQDMTEIKKYADELKKRVANVKEINEITDSLETSKPEYQFVVDKEKALANGLTSYQIASFIYDSLNGQVATKISSGGLEKDVRVKISGLQNTKESIENLTMKTPAGNTVALKNLGSVEKGQSPVTIDRENQNDVITLSMAFSDSDLGTVSGEVQAEIDKMVDDLAIDRNLNTIELSGGTEMMNDAFDDLTLAMFLAVIFVYIIMASLFGSFLYPLIILFTLPLALIGVTGGLLVSGDSFGITAFIGVIILAGIVVNNAIVFVDYAGKLIREGTAVREALIRTGLTRLRPILMTALTTILGLAPLAAGLGEGTEIQAPMAIAVIGGLFSSTVLTLIVIPVLLSIVENFRGFRKKMRFIFEKLDEFEKEDQKKQIVTAK